MSRRVRGSERRPARKHFGRLPSHRLTVMRALLPTFSGYRAQSLGSDLVAGVTLAAIAVPEELAIARLAGMPPATGLYAFVIGSVVFAAIGSNRLMSVGADSSTAPVLAAGAATVAASGSRSYVEAVTLIAVAVGLVVAISGALRLGWLADFLSEPVIAGVLTGIAVEIAVGQLPSVLGVTGGGSTTLGRLSSVLHQLGRTNFWALGVAGAVVGFIVVGDRLDKRVPGTFLAIVAATAAVRILGLRTHGVMIVGSFRGGLPAWTVPTLHAGEIRPLIGTVLTVAFLCVIQTAATEKTAVSGSRPGGLNRDLLAIGIGGVAAGLAGSFTVNASPPRTAVVQASGGRSQMAGLFASAAVVGLLFSAGLISDLPQAALGAILLFVANRLVRIKDLLKVWAFDKAEFALSAIALSVVALVGIEDGVVIASLLALAERTRLSARPRGVFLGREPGTDHWVPTDVGLPTEPQRGVLVYLPYAALWYGNAAHVITHLSGIIKDSPVPVTALVLDLDGVSDIDYTAAVRLTQFFKVLRTSGVQLGIARSSHLVHHDLKHSGLLDQIGPAHLYPSVQDAVISLSERRG